MKKVFSSASDTIHVYAQQKQPEGRSSNVFFGDNGFYPTTGNIIYSDGYHFPMGMIIGGDTIYLNTYRWSSTTSDHQDMLRWATTQYKQIEVPDTDLMKLLVNCSMDGKLRLLRSDKFNLRRSIMYIVRTHNRELLEKLANPRCNKIKWLEHFVAKVEPYIVLYEQLKLGKKPQELLKAQTLLDGYKLGINLATVSKEEIEARRKIVERDERARVKAVAKKETEALEKYNASVTQWKVFEGKLDTRNLYRVRSSVRPHDSIRYNPEKDRIETSQDIEICMAEAKAMYKIIKSTMTTGKDWHIPRRELTVSREFDVNLITATGDVKAGCHYIEHEEIEQVAEQLGWA